MNTEVLRQALSTALEQNYRTIAQNCQVEQKATEALEARQATELDNLLAAQATQRDELVSIQTAQRQTGIDGMVQGILSAIAAADAKPAPDPVTPDPELDEDPPPVTENAPEIPTIDI